MPQQSANHNTTIPGAKTITHRADNHRQHTHEAHHRPEGTTNHQNRVRQQHQGYHKKENRRYTLVIVQGRTQTGIQGAMLSIGNILDLRNAEARVRQRQQTERQTISSSIAPTSTPHVNNPALSGEQVTELLTIPTDKVRYVIGTGKQTLDNIANTSHTH